MSLGLTLAQTIMTTVKSNLQVKDFLIKLITKLIIFLRGKRKRLDSSSKLGLFSGEEEQSKEKIDPEEEKRKETERAIQQKYAS